MPKLLLSNGESLDLIIDDYNPNITLGRANCELNLSDASISSKHAQIARAANGTLCLTDLGSTNGTFINGSQLKPQNYYSLQDGDEIQFGGINTTFVEKSDPNNNSDPNQYSGQPSSNQIIHKNYEKAIPSAARQTSSETSRHGFTSLKNAEYAGFLTRMGPSLIDGLITSFIGFIIGLITAVILGVIIGAQLGLTGAGRDSLSSNDKIITNAVQIIIYQIVCWLYFALMESSPSQATPGKMMRGLKVTDMNGERISFLKATGRYWGKWISAIFYIGYIMAAFTAKKQALHDMMAGCLVVKDRR